MSSLEIVCPLDYHGKVLTELLYLVRDQHSVSVTVSAESTDIGINIEADFFFPKPIFFSFFSNFTHFFLLIGGTQVFISLKINLALQK
jgi:hypothetical protein